MASTNIPKLTPARRPWTREELIVAMNLYSRLTFGQLHARNPLIVQVAERLGRTSGSLAMKLCNLASFDPVLAARGIVGLKGASRLDRQVWDSFQENWTALGSESEVRFRELMHEPMTAEHEPEQWLLRDGPTEVQRTVRQRLGQDFFRRTVLVSYGARCCITGNPLPALLSASHIVGWADDVKERLNPRNGLCLAKTHDAAFDRHLITLDEEFRIILSKSIRDHFTSETIRVNFQPFEGRPIELPHRFTPDPALLNRHRDIFSRMG